MEKKYKALRILSGVYRIIAALIFFAAILIGVGTMITPSFTVDYSSSNLRLVQGPPATGVGLGLLIGGIIISLSLYAFGELLHLFIDLEENTRRSSLLLQKLGRGTAPARGNTLPEPDDEPPMVSFVKGRK